MPLYEYECSKCGRRLEVIQKFSDPPRARCPHCKGALKKLLSAPAIQFKGSGWYVTDYSRKGKGGDTAKGAEGEGKGEKPSKETAASESKTATQASDKKGGAKKGSS